MNAPAGPAGTGPERESVADLAALGVTAFTTTRAFGDLGWQSADPAALVEARWQRLWEALPSGTARLATARQVHGTEVVMHAPGWTGRLRVEGADGHVAPAPGTALAVTVADCVPVFLAHPDGAVALVHAGWRGTAAGIVPHAIRRLADAGCAPADVVVHLGPAICGRCYEVSPDVYGALTGRGIDRPATVDLRDVLAGQCRGVGVRQVGASAWCTRCHRARFFSHRGGDAGRQVGVILRACG